VYPRDRTGQVASRLSGGYQGAPREVLGPSECGAVIPLARAVLCVGCDTVLDLSMITCPRCTSTTLVNLSRLVNRAPVRFASDGANAR